MATVARGVCGYTNITFSLLSRCLPEAASCYPNLHNCCREVPGGFKLLPAPEVWVLRAALLPRVPEPRSCSENCLRLGLLKFHGQATVHSSRQLIQLLKQGRALLATLGLRLSRGSMCLLFVHLVRIILSVPLLGS